MAFRTYRDIFRQMDEMQQLADEAFRGFFGGPMGGAGRFWQPPVDIHETEDTLIVKMELAGAKAEDLQVSLSPDNRVLTISGARVESHADRQGRIRCHQLESYFGPFDRAVGLPSGVPVDRERITAAYRDGFLTVRMPKKPALPERPQTRQIPINAEPENATHTDVESTDLESEGEA